MILLLSNIALVSFLVRLFLDFQVHRMPASRPFSKVLASLTGILIYFNSPVVLLVAADDNDCGLIFKVLASTWWWISL